MKQIILLYLFALIGFTSFACVRNKSMSISEQSIIHPDGIVSVYFYDKESTVRYKIATDDIKTIIDILNTSRYDEERNDGKMFKMTVPSFDMDIQYDNGRKINVKLWDNIMYTDKRWYQLDIQKIKAKLSQYNKSINGI